MPRPLARSWSLRRFIVIVCAENAEDGVGGEANERMEIVNACQVPRGGAQKLPAYIGSLTYERRA